MKALFSLLILLLSCFLVSAQRSTEMGGKVIEVLTGDQIVVLTGRDTKFTVKLLYVDAPERSQELFQTAKDHLSAFVLNKDVRFDAKIMSGNVVHSRVTQNGNDIGMQMLRDGAAFFDVPGSTYQDAVERQMYSSNEVLAKGEKRGVWSTKDTTPVYQLRAEREKREKERMDREFEAYLKSAVANARFKVPTIGMHYFAFKSLCDAGSESGDTVNSHEDSRGTDISVSLETTKKRLENQCVGYFSFDTNFRLDYMSMSGHLKP
jgi:endonuclease YncB( thermonuclease family)